MPSTIENVHREYGTRGLLVLAVNMEEPAAEVAPWVSARRLSMEVLLDRAGEATTAWGVSATPTVFLLARDGKLVARTVGTRAWLSPPGRALLEALLAK